MKAPLWYSLWSFPAPYEGNDPAYLDEKDMACTKAFTAQFDAIQKEVRTFLSKRETIPYFNQSMVLHGKGYHTLSLAWG